MANVNLKTDFKNGEKLFDHQLNNNFAAIQAALDAENKIVWQDEQELPDSITAFRGTTEELMNREIIDGQLLYDVNTGETYIDYQGKRISTGSGNAIHIGEDAPSNASTQLWIENDEFMSVGTEVVNSLEGDEFNKAPSVATINNMKKLLWSNNNLDSFGETNINLSSDDYDMLQVFYTRDASDKTLLMSQFTLKGYGFWLDGFLNGESLWRRAIGRNSDTSFRVYQCNKFINGSPTNLFDNTALIPVAIYGIKNGKIKE